jgi:hypothetical protein
MMFNLLEVNFISIVSIKSLYKVINHTLQESVFTLISTHLLLLPNGKTDMGVLCEVVLEKHLIRPSPATPLAGT